MATTTEPQYMGADRVVLLTGGTGYVAGRLIPLLEKKRVALRCLARNPDKLRLGVAASTEVVAGDHKIFATAGMFVNMPIGMPHSFKNESKNPAKILIMVAPAGLENMFFETGVPLTDGSTSALPPTQEEIEKLVKIAPKYGIEILTPHP